MKTKAEELMDVIEAKTSFEDVKKFVLGKLKKKEVSAENMENDVQFKFKDLKSMEVTTFFKDMIMKDLIKATNKDGKIIYHL